MKLSILVPAYNEARYLDGTLAALRVALEANGARLGGPGSPDAELIVCDNNSSDGTAEVAARRGVPVVFEPHNQISRARNTAAAAAHGEWLLFVDADTHVPPETLADLLDHVDSGRYVAGGGDIRLDGGGWAAQSLARGLVRLFGLMKMAGGAFLFCRADALRAVGGFSTALYAGEEVALSRSLKRWGRARGLKFAFLTRHPVLTSSRKLQSHGLGSFLRLALRGMLRPGSTLRSREHLGFFYDGKR